MSIISVVGPTASGKTALAIRLAQKFTQPLVISLDTRQIYRELPILSGADLAVLAQAQVTMTNIADKSVRDEWSLGQLITATQTAIDQALADGRQVILVGGTLLYHQRLFYDNQLTQIPPDDNIRFAAEAMTTTQLQHWLEKVDAATWAELNASDRQNPRRLVRKIEIATARAIYGLPAAATTATRAKNIEQIFIQPQYDLTQLPTKINQRVRERWENGAIDEVKSVVRDNQDLITTQHWRSRLPIGFTEIHQFLENELTAAQAQAHWSLREWQYAKRQLTFLKKLLMSDHAHLVDEREFFAN